MHLTATHEARVFADRHGVIWYLTVTRAAPLAAAPSRRRPGLYFRSDTGEPANICVPARLLPALDEVAGHTWRDLLGLLAIAQDPPRRPASS